MKFIITAQQQRNSRNDDAASASDLLTRVFPHMETPVLDPVDLTKRLEPAIVKIMNAITKGHSDK